MAGVDRETFMAKVREAVRARPVTEADHPAIDESVARFVQSGDDLVGVFARNVEASGAHAHVVDSAAGFPDLISRLVAEGQIKTALCESDARAEPLAGAAEAAGAAVHRWSAEHNLDDAFSVDAGLTGCDGAVASTGSVLLKSSPDAGRMISLAPLTHIVLVQAQQIVADLLDLLGPEGPVSQSPASGMVLVTGPSKTADIELNLVTGVHGPKHVHVVVLR